MTCDSGVPTCTLPPDEMARCSCEDKQLAACTPSTQEGTRCTLASGKAVGHCHAGKCLDAAHCRSFCKAAAKSSVDGCDHGDTVCAQQEQANLEGCLFAVCRRGKVEQPLFRAGPASHQCQ